MQISKETEEKIDGDAIEITEEEQEKLDELGAQCRQIFNPIEKTYDDHKRRVTDLKECSRVSRVSLLLEKDRNQAWCKRKDIPRSQRCKLYQE